MHEERVVAGAAAVVLGLGAVALLLLRRAPEARDPLRDKTIWNPNPWIHGEGGLPSYYVGGGVTVPGVPVDSAQAKGLYEYLTPSGSQTPASQTPIVQALAEQGLVPQQVNLKVLAQRIAEQTAAAVPNDYGGGLRIVNGVPVGV